MSKIVPISLTEFLLLLEEARNSHWAEKEPMPICFEQNKGIIESCLKTPFQTAFGKSIYKTFIEKSAILFYLLIKNHPL